ncbi:MAG: DotU family type IV/VI secretion system protein [Planctomycetaceae bacterium]|nr:DotU family type IV/VI secretion system protein [Planctomycetaceae bacterium]
MTPNFSRLVNPFFKLVLEAAVDLDRNRDGVDLQLRRQRLVQELNDAEMQADQDRQVRNEDFELAKKALVYWADEVLTMADVRWKDIILERELYGSRDRGHNFYIFGERHAKSAGTDVIEVWYLCLTLGFVGDIEEAFRMHLNRELPTLKGDTGAPDIHKARRAWAEELRMQMRPAEVRPPNGEPLQGKLSPLPGQRLLPMSISAAVTALILVLGVYFIKIRLQPAVAASPETGSTLPSEFRRE